MIELADVIAKYPQLHAGGYGQPRGKRFTDDELEELRVALLGSVDEVRDAIKYLRVAYARKSDRRKFWFNSYNLKHSAERYSETYICNGAMIAAALIIGARVRMDDYNPLIDIKSAAS